MTHQIKNTLSTIIVILGLSLGFGTAFGVPSETDTSTQSKASPLVKTDNKAMDEDNYNDINTNLNDDTSTVVIEVDEYGNPISATGNALGETIRDVSYGVGDAAQGVGNAIGNIL